MARRAFAGMIWCLVLFFAARFVVGVVAGNLATVEAGQDPVATRNQAAIAADEMLRPFIMFGVVAFVFLGSRFGFLPGTRANRSLLPKR